MVVFESDEINDDGVSGQERKVQKIGGLSQKPRGALRGGISRLRKEGGLGGRNILHNPLVRLQGKRSMCCNVVAGGYFMVIATRHRKVKGPLGGIPFLKTREGAARQGESLLHAKGREPLGGATKNNKGKIL